MMNVKEKMLSVAGRSEKGKENYWVVKSTVFVSQLAYWSFCPEREASGC